MNETIAAAILGVVQGLTEFLPVSSSGHLVLFQSWLPVAGDPIAFALALHLGTLLPVLWVYRADLQEVLRDATVGSGPYMERPGVRLLWLLCLATIPTGIIGLAFEEQFEALFSNTLAVGIAFVMTGTVLWLTRMAPVGTTTASDVSIGRAIGIGIVQGLAITPGISRSGTTIAAGLFLGLERENAARLSFLLSIPAILGAFVLKAGDLARVDVAIMPLIVGFVTSAVSGYFALRWLLRLVKGGDFSRFAWYLWPLGAVSILGSIFA